MNIVRVVQGSRPTSAVVVKRTGDISLKGLTDVDSTDLQDGYTLVYDDAEKKFKTQQLSDITVNTVDGGTY